MTTLVWLRNDLRLRDNPALTHAAEDSDTVIPVFIWSPEEEGDWPPGGAHQWWLHHSLASLASDLDARDSRLVMRAGASLSTLRALIEATGATAVYWNERLLPALAARDAEVTDALREDGLTVQTFESRIVHDPDAVQTGSGGPYHVFTPFWKKLGKLDYDVAPPLGLPGDLGTVPEDLDSQPLEELGLLPEAQDGTDWAGGLREAWTPGETTAHERLAYFCEDLISSYDTERNRPDHDGTSRLSPHLHHGELSPRQVWHAAMDALKDGASKDDVESYLSEIVWREFSYHLLYHYPKTPTEPLRDKYAVFPWEDDEDALRRWQHGETGYPIVDAGMRQLYATGWMHNRVRMIVASFLTKDLLIHWRHGAEWFWDTLVDGDLASNTMGWQWAAGSGADAQPFFRIFNPISQGERYDPDGTYVKRWIPELRRVPKKYLHKPWEAPSSLLRAQGVILGETYPHPIVDHAEARDAALEAYEVVKNAS